MSSSILHRQKPRQNCRLRTNLHPFLDMTTCIILRTNLFESIYGLLTQSGSKLCAVQVGDILLISRWLGTAKIGILCHTKYFILAHPCQKSDSFSLYPKMFSLCLLFGDPKSGFQLLVVQFYVIRWFMLIVIHVL